MKRDAAPRADILVDGDMRFDMDIGGYFWFGYNFDRFADPTPFS